MAKNMPRLLSMPLRFRVWDQECKQFCVPYHEQDGTRVIHLTVSITDVAQIIKDDKSNFVISQETGLKDKNGKSIYTGDIIRWRVPTNKEKWVYASIVYLDGKIMYDYGPTFDLPNRRYEPVALVSLDDEVVGNVWENPELLERV